MWLEVSPAESGPLSTLERILPSPPTSSFFLKEVEELTSFYPGFLGDSSVPTNTPETQGSQGEGEKLEVCSSTLILGKAKMPRGGCRIARRSGCFWGWGAWRRCVNAPNIPMLHREGCRPPLKSEWNRKAGTCYLPIKDLSEISSRIEDFPEYEEGV